MKAWTAVAALVGVLAGCAHEPVYHTLSGRPEVTIENVPMQKVMQTLIEMSEKNGEKVSYITSDSFQTDIPLGKTHIPKFSHRDYEFKQSMNTVRVICSIKLITVYEGSTSDSTDITPHAGGPQCMDTLEKLKQALK